MKTISCADADTLLGDRLAAAADSEDLDAHVDGCASCRAAARAHFLQDRRLAELGLGTALKAKVHDALARESTGSPLPWWRNGGLIAASLILAGVFSVVLIRNDAPTRSPAAKPVDLLALIDPARDAVSGAWTRNGIGLVSDRAASARVEIPYHPPEEYDFRAVFTRLEGNDVVAQVCSRSGTSFAWVMGMRANRYAGFELIGWKRADGNASTFPSEDLLQNGVRHESVVQVRKDGIRAYLDGKLLSEWKAGADLLRPFDHWKLRDPALLGLATWDSRTIFHQVDLVEFSGKGVRTR